MSALATPVARVAHRLEAPGLPTLVLQHQPADAPVADVLYVHGSTFGADLSVFFALDGRSWGDQLNTAGVDVWGFDFAGYGASDRYPPGSEPVGGLEHVLPQLQRVVEAVRARNGGKPVHLLAHSWGATVAAAYMASRPAVQRQIASLVLFAPVTRRAAPTPGAYVVAPTNLSSHYPLTVWAQYRRFIEDVPRGAPQVLAEAHFQQWAQGFLATDAASAEHQPPAVTTPAGPQADVRALWSGHPLYDAGAVTVPTLLVRGEWDRVCDEQDAQGLLAALGSAHKSAVTIPGATHLMHLESSRALLYNAVNEFFTRSVR